VYRERSRSPGDSRPSPLVTESATCHIMPVVVEAAPERLVELKTSCSRRECNEQALHPVSCFSAYERKHPCHRPRSFRLLTFRWTRCP